MSIFKYLDLCSLFPTEKQRYAAFRAYIIGIVAFLGFSNLLIMDHSLNTKVTYGIVIAAVLIYCYVQTYILYKSGMLKMMLKMFIGMYLSIGIITVLGAMTAGAAFGLAVILALIANRKRWKIIKKNIRFLWYNIFLWVLLIVITLIVFASTLSAFAYAENGVTSIGLLLFSGLSAMMYVIGPVAYIFFILQREEKKGTPFFKMIFLMNTIPLLFIFLLTSFTSLFSDSFFSDNALLNDDGIYEFMDSPDLQAHNAGYGSSAGQEGLIYGSENTIPEAGVPDNADSTIYAGAAGTVAAVSDYYSNILDFSGHRADFHFDMPQHFSQNPYMYVSAVNDAPDLSNDVVRIYSSEGVHQLTVDHGSIFDAHNNVIGYRIADDINSGIKFTDINSNTVCRIDSGNNMYSVDGSGETYMGHLSDSKGVKTFFNPDGTIECYTDINGNTFTAGGQAIARTEFVKG